MPEYIQRPQSYGILAHPQDFIDTQRMTVIEARKAVQLNFSCYSALHTHSFCTQEIDMHIRTHRHNLLNCFFANVYNRSSLVLLMSFSHLVSLQLSTIMSNGLIFRCHGRRRNTKADMLTSLVSKSKLILIRMLRLLHWLIRNGKEIWTNKTFNSDSIFHADFYYNITNLYYLPV